MKCLTLSFGLMIAMILSCSSSPQHGRKGKNSAQAQQSNPKGFAVVELFTSEGCSSCPPAERLLAKLQAQYKGYPVLLIEEHVDYWDKIGWRDPFSDRVFTQRQYMYAKQFNTIDVYTPQAVINGVARMVGSNEGAVEIAIRNVLENAIGEPIALTIAEVNKGSITVDYDAGELKHAKVLLMMVQRSATSKISGGENGGRTLSHVNVVRTLQEHTDSKGRTVLTIPEGVRASDCYIAAMSQRDNGLILGIGMIDIKPLENE